MKAARYLTAAAAVAVVLLLALAWYLGQRPTTVSAPPSTSASATAPSTPTGSATPSTSATSSSAASVVPSNAQTGTITGRIGYPSEFAPPLTVYAISVNDPSVWYSTNTPFFGNFTRPTPSPTPSFTATWPPAGDGRYQLSVPAGTYQVVGYSNDTGLPKDLPVAYTEWTMRCSSSDPAQPSPPAGPCPYPHSLVRVTVAAGQTVRFIDLVDWQFQAGTYPPRPTPR